MTTKATPPITQGSVIAPDGTSLGFLRIGTGAPLVVCHGAFTVAQDWLPFAARMAASRTVYLYDRRGRGTSPNVVEDFALDAEIGDLAAMVAHAGTDTAILGHSFGGACSLAYAARHGFTGSLIVYEPPHSARGPISRGHIPEISRLAASGDHDAATHYAMREVIGMPPSVIAGFQQSPLWDGMRRTVTAFPNELRFLDSLTWQAGDLDTVTAQTTLLIGGDSPVLPDEISPVTALQSLLPAMQTVIIPGQGHVAYLTAPELLAGIVKACLEGPAGD